jgi:hypothetical protein
MVTLIEREAGGHFYYSEEEFHVELREGLGSWR